MNHLFVGYTLYRAGHYMSSEILRNFGDFSMSQSCNRAGPCSGMDRMRYTQNQFAFLPPKAYNSHRDGISHITYGNRGNVGSH